MRSASAPDLPCGPGRRTTADTSATPGIGSLTRRLSSVAGRAARLGRRRWSRSNPSAGVTQPLSWLGGRTPAQDLEQRPHDHHRARAGSRCTASRCRFSRGWDGGWHAHRGGHGRRPERAIEAGQRDCQRVAADLRVTEPFRMAQFVVVGRVGQRGGTQAGPRGRWGRCSRSGEWGRCSRSGEQRRAHRPAPVGGVSCWPGWMTLGLSPIWA